MRIAHVINPYDDLQGEKSIQKITFESLKRAKEFSLNTNNSISILSAQHAKDIHVVPDYIEPLPNLNRTVCDVVPFKQKRELPLLADILQLAVDGCDADYIIYTNVDIGVLPQFYVTVMEFIESGLDAFIINRRRLSGNYESVKELNQIYSEVGLLHNGFDCFVFKKDLFSQFQLGTVCLGIPHVGNTLALNLMRFANNFRLFTDKHLTFHLGYELVKNWGDSQYLQHNKSEYKKVLQEISNGLLLKNIPGASYPFLKRHFVWLMNPNFHYPTLMKIDFKNWNSERYPDHTIKLGGFYEWLQKQVRLD